MRCQIGELWIILLFEYLQQISVASQHSKERVWQLVFRLIWCRTSRNVYLIAVSHIFTTVHISHAWMPGFTLKFALLPYPGCIYCWKTAMQHVYMTEEEMCKEWIYATLLPIFKTRALILCKKLHGIILLCSAFKICIELTSCKMPKHNGKKAKF